MINIVVPMAGLGSRFAKKGFTDPKPLIKINGVPMIQLVIGNLKPSVPHRFIFICQREHIARYGLDRLLKTWAPGSEVVELDGLTDGAACTVLAARDLICDQTPLMIANCDQYVDTNINTYLSHMANEKLDGLIMTMKASDPKWSYVAIDKNGYVTRVVEKEVISDDATVGIYNFKRGDSFVRAAEAMIEQNLRINNEFYVAPVYNQLIARGQKIGIFNIGEEAKGMYGLGTPDDLDLFLTLPIHKTVTEKYR